MDLKEIEHKIEASTYIAQVRREIDQLIAHIKELEEAKADNARLLAILWGSDETIKLDKRGGDEK